MANSTVKQLLTNSELLAFNILLPIISLVGFFTNSVVILSVYRYRSLRRTPAYLFVVNLAIADIIVLVVGIPMWIVQLVLAGDMTISQAMTMCQITFGLTVFSSVLSIFTLGVISYDRYTAVTRPFHYHEIMSSLTTYKSLLGLWIVTLLFSLPSFAGCKAKDLDKKDASLIAYCVYTKVFRQEYLLILYTGASLTIIFNVILYTRLLKVAKRHAGQIESVKSEVENSERGNSAAFDGARRQPARREKNLKAAKTLGIILGVLLTCWVPFLVVAYIDSVQDELFVSVFTVKCLGTVSYVNSIINPIIYTYLSRDFKKAVRRILLLKRGHSNVLGNSSM